jgi:hypothetical protein
MKLDFVLESWRPLPAKLVIVQRLSRITLNVKSRVSRATLSQL